jgi:hypothetical protein
MPRPWPPTTHTRTRMHTRTHTHSPGSLGQSRFQSQTTHTMGMCLASFPSFPSSHPSRLTHTTPRLSHARDWMTLASGRVRAGPPSKVNSLARLASARLSSCANFRKSSRKSLFLHFFTHKQPIFPIFPINTETRSTSLGETQQGGGVARSVFLSVGQVR